MQNNSTAGSPAQHLIQVGSNIQKSIFIFCLLLCCTPWISSGTALFLGLLVAQLTGHPYVKHNQKATHCLLQFAVVGLGFGMNAHSAIAAGKSGILFTVASIFSTLLLGFFLGKIFKTDKKTSYLINNGTAICGGSAIAAISPVIQANEKQISVALGCVFMLNAIALYLFPAIGHALNLSQTQFGTWCAIAIHDTSSVVGASGKFGSQAQEIATTIKLARALWIIPISVLSGFLFKNKSHKIKIPYFIGLFILAMLLNTYLPAIHVIDHFLVAIAKISLTITLFLIGAGLSRSVITSVGVKPLLQAVLLWLFIGGLALFAVMHWL